MTEPIHSNWNLFPHRHPVARLSLEGKFVDGGRARLANESVPLDETYSLAPTEFAPLAILMKAARRAKRRGQPDTKAFVTKEEILAELKRRFGVADPEMVPKYIWRLRKALAKQAAHALPKTVDPAEWAKSLIEHTMLGYRVSIPAEWLNLRILDDDDDDENDEPPDASPVPRT